MKSKIILYTLVGLFIIGVIRSNFFQLLIPLLLIGTIFFLYKFPLNRIRTLFSPTKRRRSHLKVIQGKNTTRKQSSSVRRDAEKPPRYH